MRKNSVMKKIFTLIFVGAVVVATSAQWKDPQPAVPAYNPGPPKTKLPPILSKEQLWGPNFQHPFQVRAYELAAKIPAVLHQQPCYCYCDRIGHNSLHSCFESTHGASCSACLKELYYSYSMHKSRKTPARIRRGIIQGEWQKVDLNTAATIN